MISKKIMILFFLAASLSSRAGDGDYAVSKIPVELLKNANAVKRFENIRFEVFDIEKARLYTKVAYTILNEKGDKFAVLSEHYDKLCTIDNIEGRLFDAAGKKIRTLKNSEIQDKSGTGNNSLADDIRIKMHSFYCKNYPYTVEYEIEIKYNYTMFYPGWVPQEGENLSVENGRIEVIVPEGLNCRYKAFNFKTEPLITTQKNAKSYIWEIKNLAAVESEVASPHWYEITPVVCMGPSAFAVQGYKGDMSSWKEFGKFIQILNAGRDQLPVDIKQKVHELTDAISDPVKKIAVLYHFLQENSRYVSVQLGVGGWQTYDAKYVAANRYGDCKALSNYMYSLLKEAGIKSNYTLVKAGKGQLFLLTDFPALQFNHIILNVPLGKDTIWLECTSQSLPPGYLSSFTSNRSALLVTEEGGVLVQTPKYTSKENLQVRKIIADVDSDGKLITDIVTTYTAIQQDAIHDLINYNSKDKISERLKEKIDLPNYDVVSFDYKEVPSSLPSITEHLQITANNYAQVTGKRLFISPNILSKIHRRFIPNESRKFDIDLSYEYTDLDSVEIKIPAGYVAEAIPQIVKVESKFGTYNASVKFVDDKIIYYRYMEQFSGRFPSKDYGDLVKFYDQVYKADHNKVVFVKSEK